MEITDLMASVFKEGASLNRTGAQRLASQMAKHLRSGDWLFLEGDLGAGKTSFVSMIVAASSQNPVSQVSSPTFSLCHEYRNSVGGGDFSGIIHMDLYRIKHKDEMLFLGLDEMDLHDAVVVVEWGERLSEENWKQLWSVLPTGAPRRNILLQIEHTQSSIVDPRHGASHETRWYHGCYR